MRTTARCFGIALALSIIAGAVSAGAPARAEPSPDRGAAPAWKAGTIAFVSDRLDQDEIYLLDLASSRVDRLTRNPGPDRAPAWSPDGRWLAFNSRRKEFGNRAASGSLQFVVVVVSHHPAESRLQFS